MLSQAKDSGLTGRTARRLRLGGAGLVVFGIGLLALWVIWWGMSVRHNRLVGAWHTWVPAYTFLSLDFYANYHGARHWLAGGNPYVEQSGDPNGRLYGYPPAMLWFFAWCRWLPALQATY